MDPLIQNETKTIKTSIMESLSYIRKIIYSDEKDDAEITANEIIILLKWLSTISQGSKVYIKTLTISQNTVFTQLYRTFIDNESREDTLQFLYFIENKSLEILDKYRKDMYNLSKNTSSEVNEIKKNTINQQAKNLINAIIDSINGIISLKKTYIDDKMFCCFIDNLVENTIISKFSELKSCKIFTCLDELDINIVLGKIKVNLVIIENYINKDDKNDKKNEIKELQNEGKTDEIKETQNEKKKDEIKNGKKNDGEKKEIMENKKEFQISRELKELVDRRISHFDKNEDNSDYDNDTFDEI